MNKKSAKKTNAKKKKNKNQSYKITLIIVFIAFIITLIYSAYFMNIYNTNSSIYFSSYNKTLSNELNDQLDYQEEIDEKIYDILKNGGYTFLEPCVLNNPYNISPLSSLIIFKTEDETGITVKLNDELIANLEASREHVIPIYGLYSNATNIVTLIMDDGTTSELEIKTDSLNDYISNYVTTNEDKETYEMFLGGINNQESYIRGFDLNMNLVYYLKFGYIDGVSYHDDYVSVRYKTEKTTLTGLRLDIDYVGRIINVTKELDDLIYDSNITLEEDDYILENINLYSGKITNYELNELKLSDDVTDDIEVSISSISEKLIDCPTYQEDYALSTNGSYISYEFDDDVVLLLISKKDSSTHSYNLKKAGIIRVSLTGEYSLYMIKDGVYYTLLTTIEL